MNPNDDRKSEPVDPEANLRMLELELMRQRAARQQAGKPFAGLRAVSFMFLTMIILGALAAYFYLLISGRLEQMRSGAPHSPSPAAATPSP